MITELIHGDVCSMWQYTSIMYCPRDGTEWYPEYIPDQFRNLIRSSVVRSLLIRQISLKSTHNFCVLLVTNKRGWKRYLRQSVLGIIKCFSAVAGGWLYMS